ncbi:hypothetical protein COS46_01060 [Candidatus Jorgensenbacteria bacterium CG03_land_8_20_14_0_80_38_39]|nr:MAG: hypothetical protein COV54_03590 [Candidatus Jorgensenbacteria bacterium CG11_big_fil_rev_8_21_14_0_20_38_23]PIV13279.1 MAG: hypothetical protein COS46_01060 [Candidatus Jorgensenbacteria bacterium CG03_land_8_20_14_0_80_38_39]PJA95001.1 MAG: hypothetical protein CO130_01490 [Candidatus Jorgensenbacteria bacterium CG_4_9_14_3_um_filter_38_10]
MRNDANICSKSEARPAGWCEEILKESQSWYWVRKVNGSTSLTINLERSRRINGSTSLTINPERSRRINF